MLVKAALMYAIARAGGAPNETAQRIAVALAEGGEFAFVLFAAARGFGILERETTQLLVMVVTVSMLLAPGAFRAARAPAGALAGAHQPRRSSTP